MINSDWAFTFVISGEPNDFIVHLGVRKWNRNIATVAFDQLSLSSLFLDIDVQDVIWSRYVDDGIVRNIASLVG